jgi:GPH family glycoside/pentoside/hexuronide:cation symporter
MAVISKSSKERARISSIRFIFAFLGGFVIVQFLPPLTESLGHGDPILGFRHTMGLFAGLATVLFLITFFTTKERITPQTEKFTKARLVADLKLLFKERAYLILIIAGLLNLTAVAIKNGSNIYYFKYFVGTEHYNAEVSSFGGGGWIAMILGVMTTGFLIKHFERRKLIIWLTIFGGVGMILPYWMDPNWRITMSGLETGPYSVFGLSMTSIQFIPENPRWIYILNLLASFAAGPPVAIVWSMYTDIAAFIDWKHSRRITGLVVSAAVFSQKFGMAFGGWFAATLMGAFGFVAHAEQTADSKWAILLLFSLIPGILIVGQGAIMLLYPLTDDQVKEIEIDLENRDHPLQ